MFEPRVGEGLQPLQQIYAATSMIGYATDPPRFFGSCFFVAKTPWQSVFIDDNRAVVFLVTAAHVVRRAVFERRQLCVRVARYETVPWDMPLPNDGWSFAADGADVAVIPLPELKHNAAVGGFAIPVISHEQFFMTDWQLTQFDFRFGDTVRIVGLWYGDTKHPQLIVRSGNIATATVGAVQTDSGAVPAYLADVSVTRAMSGGPVFATQGSGWAETAVIGVNHGYWPILREELPDLGPATPAEEETTEDRAHRRLLMSVERLELPAGRGRPRSSCSSAFERANIVVGRTVGYLKRL